MSCLHCMAIRCQVHIFGHVLCLEMKGRTGEDRCTSLALLPNEELPSSPLQFGFNVVLPNSSSSSLLILMDEQVSAKFSDLGHCLEKCVAGMCLTCLRRTSTACIITRQCPCLLVSVLVANRGTSAIWAPKALNTAAHTALP